MPTGFSHAQRIDGHIVSMASTAIVMLDNGHWISPSKISGCLKMQSDDQNLRDINQYEQLRVQIGVPVSSSPQVKSLPINSTRSLS